MERQARFLLMGVFVLAFAAAIFASVYWLHGFKGLGATTVYMVRFEGGAPGVEVGSSVLFDGVRVGEVATISFNPADPNEVLAKIVVDQKTPVRMDTLVGVDAAFGRSGVAPPPGRTFVTSLRSAARRLRPATRPAPRQ